MPYLRLLGAQVAIGAAALFARYALTGAGPIAIAALRLGIAAVIALALAGRLTRLNARREVAFGIAGGALALHFAAWFASLLFTSVALSTLLVTTTPLWTELYDTVRARRAPAPAFAGAVGLALGGGWLIATARVQSVAPLPGHAAAGAAFALLGAVAIGAYLVIVRAAGGNGTARLDTRHIVARTYAWAAMLLLPAALVAHESAPPAANLAAWGGIFAMALVSQSLGHTALNAALRHFSPSTIALSTLLEPAFAALLAAGLLHEALSVRACAGALLVLAAVGAALAKTKV